MAKLIGRLGWHGQCACCSGPAGKDTIRAQEERAWRAEAAADMAPECPESTADAEAPLCRT